MFLLAMIMLFCARDVRWEEDKHTDLFDSNKNYPSTTAIVKILSASAKEAGKRLPSKAVV
jgi:hypothetical protein